MSALAVLILPMAMELSAAYAAEPKATSGKWENLYLQKKLPGSRPLPQNSPLKSLKELNLTSARASDPNLLGRFVIDGEMGTVDGFLARISGRNSAVQLVPEAGDFELESKIAAGGVGGWFWLLGWKDGHGYALYNVTLVKSGSSWVLEEYRGGVGIDETFQVVNRFEWREPQGLRMSVIENRLNVAVGTATIARDIELENYHPGAIVVGTYDTQYGPRDLRIQSLRYRTVTVKSP